MVDVEGLDTITEFELATGAVLQIGSGPGLYLRPFGGLSVFDDGTTAGQWHVGGAVGTRLPFLERMATRLEGGVAQAFANDDFDEQTTIFASIGFSFFTR